MVSINTVNLRCTCCNGSIGEVFLQKNVSVEGEKPISVYRCKLCQSFFLADYSTHYEAELYDYYNAYEGASEDSVYDQLTVKSYLNVLQRVLTLVGRGEILDVGCGKGDFVRVAIRHGWRVRGIDLSEPAVRIARRFSIPVEVVDFFSDAICPNSYDIITMFEVLEHLPSPVEFLKRAESVIRPGGLLYITTPNFNSLDRRIFSENWEAIHREHLSYFTPDTLRAMIFKNTTFRVIDIETRNVSPKLFDKLNFIKRARGPGGKHPTPNDSSDNLRYLIDKSPSLRFLKLIVNRSLRITGLGNTIVATLRRP